MKKGDKGKAGQQRRRMHRERTGRAFSESSKKITFEPSDLLRDTKEDLCPETEESTQAQPGFLKRALALFTNAKVKGI